MKKTAKILALENRLGESLEDFLRREYLVNRRSALQISSDLSVGDPTVRNWLRKYGIPVRGISEAMLPEGVTKPTKEQLERMYVYEFKTTTQIAQELDLSNTVISIWLKEYDIPIRGRSAARLAPKRLTKPTKEQLEQWYVDEKIIPSQIAKKVGVNTSTIKDWLREYHIQIRNPSEAQLLRVGITKPTKEELEKWYVHEEKNAAQIGENVGVPNGTVLNWLKEYDIPIRSVSETMLLRKRLTKPTKEQLEQWYVSERKSFAQIARDTGLGQTTIRRYLERYGVPLRTSVISPQQFLNLLQKDKTARNLAAASLFLNDESYDIEQVIIGLYDGHFKDQEQLHKLLKQSEKEIYRIIEQGITNLGFYIGRFSIGDRSIVPVLLGEALLNIPGNKVSQSLEEKMVRILRLTYSPKFNQDPDGTMEDIRERMDSSKGRVKGLYRKLYQHYREVKKLEAELSCLN
ncbi:hypothetical protein J4458_01250 [Candidatus Woesearchaeota archaeon]|nr:hypothetical protein [Candidatus Woesearchaeota archaeon]